MVSIKRAIVCALLLLSVVYIDASHFIQRLSHVVPREASTTQQRPAQRALSSILVDLRGGAETKFNINDLLSVRSSPSKDNLEGTAEVIVATSVGSSFLDKRKKLVLPRSATVLELKGQLSSKFPGSPPIALQRLFYDSRLLNDTELIGHLSPVSPMPIALDMITGTSAYNRTLSVAQAIEAYVASMVHQAYIGAKMQELHTPSNGRTANPEMESKYYSDLFRTLNESLYEQYKEDIALALEQEKEPDVKSPDTQAWRNQDSAPPVSPLAAALAKEFDLNWRGLRHFTYYSLVIAVRGFA